MSAPVAWIGQLRIERSLNSVMPVRQVQPNAVRMMPVCSACCTQSSDQRQYCANSSRCWLSISCASNVETPSRPAKVSADMPYCDGQQHDLVPVAHLGVRSVLVRPARHGADALGETPDRDRRDRYMSSMLLTGPQCPSDSDAAIRNSMRRIVDVGDRHSRLGLDQRAQPHRRREDPLRRLRLRARCLGLERPQHRAIAAVGADRQLDLAHLVARVA